ncbi:hypothetical protein DE170_003421 [Clostridium acetobutylicum]|nr:hypothetical protein [Clostridium acetobutylicum]NRY56940.1 hypothetical protein [Clostridium acetobutylicum]NYC94803.1 hypothetical protein [Clostridium acetobutylicum]
MRCDKEVIEVKLTKSLKMNGINNKSYLNYNNKLI